MSGKYGVSMLQWLTLIVSVFLQLLFGAFAAGGLAGGIAIARHWKSASGDKGPLAVVAILCLAAIVVGIQGILATKKRAQGEEIDAIQWHQFHHRGAGGKIVAGSLLLAVGIGWTLMISLLDREVGPGVLYWYAPIMVGLSQILAGLKQLRTGAPPRQLEHGELDPRPAAESAGQSPCGQSLDCDRS